MRDFRPDNQSLWERAAPHAARVLRMGDFGLGPDGENVRLQTCERDRIGGPGRPMSIAVRLSVISFCPVPVVMALLVRS